MLTFVKFLLLLKIGKRTKYGSKLLEFCTKFLDGFLPEIAMQSAPLLSHSKERLKVRLAKGHLNNMFMSTADFIYKSFGKYINLEFP